MRATPEMIDASVIERFKGHARTQSTAHQAQERAETERIVNAALALLPDPAPVAVSDAEINRQACEIVYRGKFKDIGFEGQDGAFVSGYHEGYRAAQEAEHPAPDTAIRARIIRKLEASRDYHLSIAEQGGTSEYVHRVQAAALTDAVSMIRLDAAVNRAGGR